jgi:hypothetical protein
MLTPQERQVRIAVIRSFPARLRHLVAGLTAEQLTTHYLPKEWTVAQNVHHLVDSHINSLIRFKLILTEERPPLKGYSQDDWANHPDANTAYIENSLAILEGLHDRWALLLESLNEVQYQRVGIHTERGEVSIDDLIVTYSDHCDAHTEQITRTLAAQPR